MAPAPASAPVPVVVPVEAVPAKSVPVKSVPASVQVPADASVQAGVQSPVVAPVQVEAAVSPAKSVPAPADSPPAAAEQKVEPQSVLAEANVPSQNSSDLADTTKAEPSKPSKKKFFSPLKKVGPIRLVNGFRSSHLRPRISLDSQKDVADNVREWLYDRRNKYEKFVDNVLGKANPISAKAPAPGADSSANDAAAAAAVVAAADAAAGGAVGVATPATPVETQRDPSGK